MADVDEAEAQLELTKKLLEPLLGQPDAVKWAALSDAVAMLLACTQSKDGDRRSTVNLRLRLLEMHIEQVLRLTPENEKLLLHEKPH